MFKVTRCSANMACGKKIQLLLTTEYLSLFPPCFLGCRKHWAVLGMSAIGTMGALGPVCLVSLSLRVDYNKPFRQEDRCDLPPLN